MEDLALYDNESWNDPRDFTKPVKAIYLHQDILSTSNRHLIELENQVQCLLEAHLAPNPPVQVNKIASSCEICSGPHDTQYCMENPEQAFVDYASSRTDEAGGKWFTFKPEQNNLVKTLAVNEVETPKSKEPEKALEDEFKDLHINLPVLEVLAHVPIYDALLDKYIKSLELAIASVVIDCRKAKIAAGEGITRSIFGVKEIDFGEENIPYWTTIEKRESYTPRPSTDRISARPPYYAKKDFFDNHLPGEWEIARDAELNHFKDILVFRKMVEFLGTIPINLKGNTWESKELIENKIDWNMPPKEGDGAWHIKIELIDPGGERFDRAF
ncbi:hypothetical protein Tco_0382678 [Tanacetum coccineum]